jgi:hypothetical protein
LSGFLSRSIRIFIGIPTTLLLNQVKYTTAQYAVLDFCIYNTTLYLNVYTTHVMVLYRYEYRKTG